MKLSRLEIVLAAKDAFVEELQADPQFEGIEAEEAQVALSEISEILDAVMDENQIGEEDELDADDEDGLLDAAEEASAQDEDDFDQLHQAYIQQNLDAADGKAVVIIEVGGPQATINVNPDSSGGASAPPMELLPETAAVDDASTVVIDGDAGESFDEPFADEDLDEAPLTASFSRTKASRLALNSALQGKTTLRSLASAVKRPVRAHKITISQSWISQSAENKRAFAASALLFASKNGHLPATAKEFGQVLFNAAERIGKTGKAFVVPFVSLKSSQSTSPFRALLISRLRDTVSGFEALTSGFQDMSDADLDKEHVRFEGIKKGWKGTAEDKEGMDAYHDALRQQKGISMVKKSRQGGGDPSLNPAAARAKANSPWAMASLMPKYRAGKITNAEAVSLFSSLITEGLLEDLGASFQKDAGRLIAQGMLNEDGSLPKGMILSGDQATFPRGAATKGKNSAGMPYDLAELPGLPFMPSLLASSARPQAITSAEMNDDGDTPSASKLTHPENETVPVVKNMEKVGPDGGIPGRRRVDLTSPLNGEEMIGRGAIGEYGTSEIPVPHEHPQGFSKVDVNGVTVDHVEITPLKVLEASVQYRMTPFISVNSNFSVASKNLVLALSKKAAAALGLPIHQNTILFSGTERPDVVALLSKAQVAEGFVKPRERTVVKSNKALMLKNSQFASVIIKAGLVGGADGTEYHTFRRMGDAYISSSGHSFPVADGIRYGRPEFLVISADHKQFFEVQSKVKINSGFEEVLSRVDTQVLESTKKQAFSAERESDLLKARLAKLTSSFTQVKTQAQKDLIKANRHAEALASELAAVKSSLTQVKLEQRVQAAAPAPVAAPRQVDQSFALKSSSFQKLAGKKLEAK